MPVVALRHIVVALKRHEWIVGLIILQALLALAVLENTLPILKERFFPLTMTSGFVEDSLVVFEPEVASTGAAEASWWHALDRLDDFHFIRSHGYVNNLPFSSHDTFTTRIERAESGMTDMITASVYMFDATAIDALDLEITSGRMFEVSEFLPGYRNIGNVHSVVVSAHVAERIRPGGSAVGSTIKFGATTAVIVGVVGHLPRPAWFGRGASEDSILIPISPEMSESALLVARLDRKATSKDATDIATALDSSSQASIHWNGELYSDIRSKYFSEDTAVFFTVLLVILSVLGVSGFGVAGLSAFWVGSRAHQVATRRALGARKVDILVFFLVENFLICATGVFLGSVVSIALNLALVYWLHVPMLGFINLLVGAVIVILVGQVACFVPARTAASVAPAVAARGTGTQRAL